MTDAVSVLLIEPENSKRTADALAKIPGLFVSRATSWSMALRMMSTKGAELLVVDLNLPDEPNLDEMANKLCDLTEKFPIVVLSASDTFELRRQCMNAGCVAVLHKNAETPTDDEIRRALTKAVLRTQRHRIDSEVVRLSAIVPQTQANGI